MDPGELYKFDTNPQQNLPRSSGLKKFEPKQGKLAVSYQQEALAVLDRFETKYPYVR